MQQLVIRWVGPPNAQMRHRFNGTSRGGNGHVYDPSAVAKRLAGQHAVRVVPTIPAIPVGTACCVDLVIRYPAPVNGAALPLARADVDNLAKFYLDAVNGLPPPPA